MILYYDKPTGRAWIRLHWVTINTLFYIYIDILLYNMHIVFIPKWDTQLLFFTLALQSSRQRCAKAWALGVATLFKAFATPGHETFQLLVQRLCFQRHGWPKSSRNPGTAATAATAIWFSTYAGPEKLCTSIELSAMCVCKIYTCYKPSNTQDQWTKSMSLCQTFSKCSAKRTAATACSWQMWSV